MAYRRETIQIMTNTPGTERFIRVHRFGKRGARPKIYMHAAIHANELPGVMLLHHLIPMLAAADRAGKIKGEIIVVPMSNPIGFSQILNTEHLGRYAFVNRDNFNRNHYELSAPVAARIRDKLTQNPAANVALIRDAALRALAAIKPRSELQSWRKALLGLSIDSDIVFDLHCDVNAALHHFIGETDIEKARILVADLGIVACMYNSPYPTTATFAGVNGTLWPRLAEIFPNVPIPNACFSSTVELRGQADANDANGATDAKNLFRYLVRVKAIAGSAGPLPRAKGAITAMSGMDVGYAPTTGMLAYRKQAGARVRQGEVICEVVDPLTGKRSDRSAVTSAADGILFARLNDGQLVHPGQVLFRIAGRKVLRHRIGMTGLDD